MKRNKHEAAFEEKSNAGTSDIEAGQASGSTGDQVIAGYRWPTPADAAKVQSGVNNDGLSEYLQEQLQTLGVTLVERSTKSKIQRVPFRLRERHLKHFQPVLLAFGPIHHRRFLKTESVKLNLASLFIKHYSVDRKMLCNMILTKIKEFKECYAAEVLNGYNDDELTWMFLVDGCAVVCFMEWSVDFWFDSTEEYYEDFIELVGGARLIILRDLFLFENQLPFSLLSLITSSTISQQDLLQQDLSKLQQDLLGRIKTFVALHVTSEVRPSEIPDEPSHLLDLYREFLLMRPKSRKKRSIFEALAGSLGGSYQEFLYPYTFRNVTELKASGIGFKRSETDSLTDVSFDRGWFLGDLKLPLLILSDDTAAIYLNLLAYEMCPDFRNDHNFTSYICFMDSLIDQPEDVAVLRKANIVRNHFGSDEEVSKFFNEIRTDLAPNPSMYFDVRHEISLVYKSKRRIWIAQLLNDYFSSPWTITAFVGAMIALVLTSVQTWYAINPKK